MSQDVERLREHQRTKSAASVASTDSKNESSTRPINAPRARSKRTTEQDPSSDEATAAFVRRILCAHQLRAGSSVDKERTTPRPLEELLPPLTSSNEVDLQLYALIAIIIKDFVQSWYSRITPDHEFTDEIVQIIAHCTRGLEQRLRKVDLESLFLDDIPAILAAHVEAYRTAYGGIYSTALGPGLRPLYHALHPHPALSPVPDISSQSTSLEQVENEAAWRQLLVQGVLALLLPPEDLENPCLRVLVTEIFSELILGNGVCGKACEGWLLWEIVIKIVEIVRSKGAPLPIEVVADAPVNRLEQFGLLSSEGADTEPMAPKTSSSGPLDWIVQLFLQAFNYIAILLVAVRAVYSAYHSSALLPERTAPSQKHRRVSSNIKQTDGDDQTTRFGSTEPPIKRPIIAMSIWPSLSYFLSMDLRMPWLTGFLALLQWILISGPGKVGNTNSRLDRLLSHRLHSALQSPSLLPSLLLNVRLTLFPNNTMGPARVPPTPAEALAIKSRCASLLISSLPAFVRARLFGTAEEVDTRVKGDVEAMLDVFGDAYLNKHWLFAVVELVVSRLFPELEVGEVTGVMGD